MSLSLRGETSNTPGGVANQSWTLDSQGNWSSYTSNGTTQTQTANAQNQITSISGTAGTPVYDANGNMTTDQSGNTYVYNAWNQLVSVKNASGQIIAQYTYNATGYRITESYPLGGNGVAAGTTNYIYYDSSWQAIETRTGGTANSNVTSQTVWSAAYINAAVLQDTYSAGVIQPTSRLYFEQDANWDTTAVVSYNTTTGTWGVTQRYVYSPYGTITLLNADWSTPPSGTQPLVDNLYQGMTLDPVTGLYYARNRNYDTSLGRWINQDPAGYINGANTYQFVMSNPAGNVDPWGLELASQSGPWGVPPGQLTPPTLSGLVQDAQTAAADTWNGLSNFWNGFNNFGMAAMGAFGNLMDQVPALGMVLPGGEFAPEGKIVGELGEQVAKDLKPNAEPKPETKGLAREPYPQTVYKGVKDAPNYPAGFRPVRNGMTKNPVTNQRLLNELREIEPGNWQKVYNDGFDGAGNRVSIHYFQSPSGNVFNVQVKPGWSNQ